ncbi:MAG: HAD family hydrolase [Candidatus Omnitrophica bacterium]|nr:HAD family hydrolase [Candidatus Omnitrophota bacterium]
MAILGAPAPAIFLDRDGVINRSPGPGYVTRWEEFAFLPGSLTAIQALTHAGWPLFIISNQRGAAQGLYTRAALDEITAAMVAEIARMGGAIAGVLYCLHDDADRCGCRKPARGLIDQACRMRPVDLTRSYVIGDDLKDIVLGRAVGCRTILVLSGRTAADAVKQWPVAPDRICRDLEDAASWILAP